MRKRSVSEVSTDEIVAKLQRLLRVIHLPEEIWGEIVRNGKEFTTKDFFHILLACGDTDIRNYLVSPEIVSGIHWVGVANWRTMGTTLPPTWMMNGITSLQLNLRGFPEFEFEASSGGSTYDDRWMKVNDDAYDLRFLKLLSSFKNLKTLVLNDENENGLGHVRFTQIGSLPPHPDYTDEDGSTYGNDTVESDSYVNEHLETLKMRLKVHPGDVIEGNWLKVFYAFDLGCFPNLKNLEITDFDPRIYDKDLYHGKDYLLVSPRHSIRRGYYVKKLDNLVVQHEFEKRPVLISFRMPYIKNPIGVPLTDVNIHITTVHIKPSYPTKWVVEDEDGQEDWFDGRVVMRTSLERFNHIICKTLYVQNTYIKDRDRVFDVGQIQCETFVCQDCCFSNFSIAFNMRTVKHFIILDKYDQKTLLKRTGLKLKDPTSVKKWFLDKIHPESKIESITYHEGVFSDEEVDKLANDVWNLTGRTLTVNKKPNPLFQQQKEVKKEKEEDRMEIQTHVEQKGFLPYKRRDGVNVTKSEIEMILDNVDLFEVANKLTVEQ